VGHLDIAGISYSLADGRPLLADVAFRVGQGSVTALIGPNGTGKTTLLRIITGELDAEDGAISRSGGLGVMSQFIGSVRDDSTVRDLLLAVSPAALRAVAAEVDATELEMMGLDGGQDDDAKSIRYAQALSDWADVQGYEQETAFDVACVAALGVPYDRAKFRAVTIDSVRRRAEAAGAGAAAGRSGRRSAARRAGQLSRRTRQDLAGGEAGRHR